MKFLIKDVYVHIMLLNPMVGDSIITLEVNQK